MEITTNLGKVRPTFMGAYNSDEYYEKLDVVYYEGTSYVSKGFVHNQLPTNKDYWHPLFDKVDFDTVWRLGTYYNKENIAIDAEDFEQTQKGNFYWAGDPNVLSRQQITDTTVRHSAYWRYNKLFDPTYNRIAVLVKNGGTLKVIVNASISDNIAQQRNTYTFEVVKGWNVLEVSDFYLTSDGYSVVFQPITCDLALVDETTTLSNDKDLCTPINFTPSTASRLDEGSDYFATHCRLVLDFGYKK